MRVSAAYFMSFTVNDKLSSGCKKNLFQKVLSSITSSQNFTRCVPDLLTNSPGLYLSHVE